MKTRPADLAEAQTFLRRHPTPGATVQGLAAAFAACERQTFGAGDVICREGTPADALFFLLLGGIEVRKRGTDGAERRLGSMQSPCVLGQIALVDRSVRTATCVAEGPVLLATLPRATFEALIAEPSAAGVTLRRLLLTSLSRQLSAGHGRLGHLVDRLARALKRASPGGVTPDGGWDGLEAELAAVEVVYGGEPRRRAGRTER